MRQVALLFVFKFEFIFEFKRLVVLIYQGVVEIFNSLMILELADDNAILSKKVIMDNMDKTVSTWYLFFIRSLRVLQYNQLETNSLYPIKSDNMRYLFPISKREQSNFHIVMYHLLPSLFLKGGKSYILITHY